MNTRERFVRTLTGREVDRLPFIKVFGGTNAHRPEWEAEHAGIGQCIDELLRFEGTYRGWGIAGVNCGLVNVPPGQKVEETAEYVIWRDGLGAVGRQNKSGDFAHGMIQWAVKDARDWDRVKSRYMDPRDPSRFAGWAEQIERLNARDWPLQLTHGGVYGFARNLMGDEALLLACYDWPDLVADIMNSYTDMVLAVWERMVADVRFDLIEFWEDMACKNGPLVSPAIFERFMAPNYRKVAAFAAAHGIEILLVDSDGNIEELTGWMLAAGVTALYPYEVRAGNDAAKMLDRHPTLGVIGALDKTVMAAGRDAIDAEIERARTLIRKGRLIPGPDHFVLSDTTFANYRYFMERLREVVLTTRPGS